MSDSEQPDSSTGRLTPERYARVQALVEEATSLALHARRPFLEQACGADTALLSEALALLAAHDALELGVGAVPAGTWIGPYCIQAELGRGGMGVVYRAEQAEPLRRTVALKLIQAGLDTRQVVARFESERQALARMDHPNIAHVYDAGATRDGRPFFAMEFVAGVPITAYCDTHRVSMPARLALFGDVCAAVQHAHQKGVIHRDLKPSNVLVLEQDGRPVPKVIDFGVAKAIASSDTERSLFTEHGQIVGTPENMSPEQAALSADIDTTTDVYALGVLLYELLVGALPFDSRALRAAGYDEMRRIIRETDPPRPSSRLAGLGDEGTAVAAQRHTDVGPLARQLRGDLDWITLKALEKDRRRRYETPAALAADVRRHLRHEPVVARPPSVVYRTGKLVRRHALLVAASALVLAAIVTGLGVSTSMYARAERARRGEMMQRQDANARRLEADSQRAVAERESQAAVAARDRADAERAKADYRAFVSTVAAADADLKANEPSKAERRLLGVDQKFRNTWEWRYLFSQTDTSIATLLALEDSASSVLGPPTLAVSTDGRRAFLATRHLVQSWSLDKQVRSTVFSTDRQILAMNADATVVLTAIDETDSANSGDAESQMLEIVELASGAVVGRLAVGRRFVQAKFSKAGDRIVTGSSSAGGLALWNERSAERIGFVPGGSSLEPLDISADGSRVIAGDTLWSQGLRAPSKLKGADRFLRAATLTPDGSRVVASQGFGLGEWDTQSGDLVRVLYDDNLLNLLSGTMTFSPDGRFLAVGKAGGAVDLWDISSGRIVGRTVRDDTQVSALAFSSDGGRLFSAHGPERPHVRVWDTRRLQLAVGFPRELGLQAYLPSRVPADPKLAAAVRLPHLPDWMLPEPSLIKEQALSGDGRHVAFAMPGHVGVWSLDSLTLTRQTPIDMVERLVLSNDARRAVVRTAGGALWWSGFDDGPPVRLSQSDVTAIAISPDGALVAAGIKNTAQVWNISRGSERMTLNVEDPVSAITIDALGRRVFVVTRQSQSPTGSLQAWDLDTKRRLWGVSRKPIDSVALSNDGRAIAIAWSGSSPTLQVLSAATGVPRVTMRPLGSAEIRPIAFSPDGLRIAQGTDGSLHTWDVTSGSELLTLRWDVGFLRSVSYSEDGKRLVALGHGVRVYYAEPPYEPGARDLVTRLYDELQLSDEVLARLRSSGDLDSDLRRSALALAKAWGDSAAVLIGESQAITELRTETPARYRRALRMAERAVQLDPRSSPGLLALGMAEYRTGEFHRALDTLNRADRVGSSLLDVKRLVKALTYARLNRFDEARLELEPLRRRLDDPDYRKARSRSEEIPSRGASYQPRILTLLREFDDLVAKTGGR